MISRTALPSKATISGSVAVVMSAGGKLTSPSHRTRGGSDTCGSAAAAAAVNAAAIVATEAGVARLSRR